MHIEIQVALNFVISYLYNKLPRRRVNLFGEELEKALRQKFAGHWYPEKPFKGSAYRCVRISDQLDSVIEIAARESGLDVQDIVENLPSEMSVWIDPGEVSYRISEKGPVKVLYSESEMAGEDALDREVTRSFNPEAQCFRPVDAMPPLGNLSNPAPPLPAAEGSAATSPLLGAASSPSTIGKPSSPVMYPTKSTAPLTFTTASFAQTKFGSTKLKTSSKRTNRMSPTEFSNYIKQRALIQQQQQHLHQHMARPRSLSPDTTNTLDPFLLMAASQQQQNGYLGDLLTSVSGSSGMASPVNTNTLAAFMDSGHFSGIADGSKALLDGLSGLNFNGVSYPNQHQHLLVAN